MRLADDLKMGWRYASGLIPFLRRPRVPADPIATARAQFDARADSFLASLHQGIFANPASPYLALLRHADVAEQDVITLVRQQGIEPTLRQLYDAGVHVTLDEFKGRVPITRPGLELPATAADFDNPLAKRQLESVTGGSRTRGTRVLLDLDDFEGVAACQMLALRAMGALDLPQLYWRPAAPAFAALKYVLICSRYGVPVWRWYSQTRPGPRRPGGMRGAIVHTTTWVLTALAGHPTPYPHFAPMNAAEPIARYLAEQTRRGAHLYIDTLVSSAIQLCRVAADLQLDISGHTFGTTGEPLTPAKAMMIYNAGGTPFAFYGMMEAGRLGKPCGTPNALDDIHLLTHRSAFIQLPKPMPGWPQPVGALYVSNVRPTAPKVLLNVETGDYGVMSERQCGCPLGQAGFNLHLHTIRNYEKLTSVGMHFMGADLIELLEVALPKRYGGVPTDYQFVEAEENARTVLKLVISPRVGPLNGADVATFVLHELERRTAGGRLMTDVWRDSDTLQIERVQPYATGSAKIQPLHVSAGRLRCSQ